ncbi:MAG: SPOR domain-containing protein, partial [Muribaculaceae bacterium]
SIGMKQTLSLLRSKLGWITGIITTLSVVLGLVNDVPGALGLFSTHSGSVALLYKGEKVTGTPERNVVVCLDSVGSASLLNGIYPTFSNNTGYGVNNFAMRYTIESQSVMFEPTDYYSMTQEGDGCYVMKYKESMLPAFTTVERPVKKFFVAQNGGKLHLKAQASYDGVEYPMIYDVYARFFVVPYPKVLSFDEWKRRCQERFLPATSELKECDVYYLTRDNGTEQEINVNLGAIAQNRVAPTPSAETRKPKATPRPVAAPAPSTTVKKPASPEPKLTDVPTAPVMPSAATASGSTVQPPFNLRVIGYGNSSKWSEYVKLLIDNVQCDTTMMMLVLLEDSVSHNRTNELWRIRTERKYGYTQEVKNSVKPGYRIVDYAFCRENKQLADSIVKNDEDEYLKNITYRSVGVLAIDSLGFCRVMILKAEDALEGEGNNRMYFTNFKLAELRYYELPEYLLIDDYKPIDKYERIRVALKWGHWMGLFMAGFVLLLILCFIASDIWDERRWIRSWNDLVKYIYNSWGEGESYTKMILQILMYPFAFYLGGVLIVFIFFVIF